MAQGPIKVSVTQPGGNKSTLQVNAAAVIKASPGVLVRVLTQTVGTAGSLTLNDNNATGASNTTANQIASLPFGNANIAAGGVLELYWPCATGITVSAVPTGWVGSISYS